MSYCVNCGVELDRTAACCPLCQTPVINPGQPVDTQSPKPFPVERGEVPLVSKQELALLVTAMLACAAVCCGILNLFMGADRLWSLYVIGAAVMLWIWLVPPLLMKGMHLVLRLLMDIAAVAIYVYLISLDLNWAPWYRGVGLPIILWGGIIVLVLGLVLKIHRRSILAGLITIIASIGIFVVGVEGLVDRWVSGAWAPSWSLVVLVVCIGLDIPLIIISRAPSLREEMRRRFHT